MAGGLTFASLAVEGTRVRKGAPLVDLTDNDPALMQRLDDERTALQRSASIPHAVRLFRFSILYLFLLFVLMAFAIYNDINRLISG